MANEDWPPDDETVFDPTRLYRRVPKDQLTRNADGHVRPSSGAFNSSDRVKHDMSIWLEDTMRNHQPEVSPSQLVDGQDEFLAWITASHVRSEQQVVVRSPRTEPPPHIGDAAHGDVIGKKNPGRRGRLANAAVWEVEPPDDAVPTSADRYGLS